MFNIEWVLKEVRERTATPYINIPETYIYKTFIYKGYVIDCENVAQGLGIFQGYYTVGGVEKLLTGQQVGQVNISEKESVYLASLNIVLPPDFNFISLFPFLSNTIGSFLSNEERILVNVNRQTNTGFKYVYNKKLSYSGYTETRSQLTFPLCYNINLNRVVISATSKIDLFKNQASAVATVLYRFN